MTARITRRQQMRFVVALLIGLLCIGIGPSPQPIYANNGIFGAWGGAYPNSTSGQVNCQLCHVNVGGNSPWNAYGWNVRQQIKQGMSSVDAFRAVEALDSDGNGKSNLVEIMFSVQPGWAAGDNLGYASNGVTETVAMADSPSARLDLSLADPITEKITNTGAISIALSTVITDLVSPVMGTATPGLPAYLFVVDQPGQIWQVNPISGTKTLFLDVASSLTPLGVAGPGSFDERGLLGFAFHPQYANNGLIYTYASEPVNGTADYTTIPTTETANHQSVIAQWTVQNPTSAQGTVMTGTKKVLLRIDQPQFNHDGGALAFGPDNMLYIALGDGGNRDDEGVGHGTAGNSQDNTNPLGTILRIDPLGNNSTNGQYSIPGDNPFVGTTDGALTEIYAYGLRNPFRMSFDSTTGDLYTGDVGQGDIEEIDVVVAGGNYGWAHKEGTFFFDGNGDQNGFATDLNVNNLSQPLLDSLRDPIAQYDHDEGISVIGGFVYRGGQLANLTGRYIFGDWSTSFGAPQGRLFYLDGGNAIKEFQLLNQPSLGLFLNGFGQDATGELYILGNTTGNPFPAAGQNTGVVQKIISVQAPTTYTLTISTTGDGTGNVTLDPAGGAYVEGTVVTLTATADSRAIFNGWSGDLTGATNPTTITMDGNKSVMAEFGTDRKALFLPYIGRDEEP